jgi:hypothetical protein
VDIPGTSLTLTAAILGAIQGQLGSLINKWIDYKYKLKHLKCDTYLKDMEMARSATGKSFLITRRILAVTTAAYIFVFPSLMAYLSIPISVAYVDTNGLLRAIWEGWNTMHWETLEGFVMTPTQTYLASLTWTLYFGGKNVW